MFTGIVEAIGILKTVEKERENFILTVESPISEDLKIDQSISHNGVCLTVVGVQNNVHTVVAIKETLDKTNLKYLKPNELLNLERCMKADGRFDGHIVQGHVDCTAILQKVENQEGSFLLTFQYQDPTFITVEKGSVCVNGISLTVINSLPQQFSVAVIPYTWEHTNLSGLKINDLVNLEFDVLGKYIQKILGKQ